MLDPQRFRSQLAARILGLLSVAALFVPDTSCGAGIVGGTGGAAGSTGPGSSGVGTTGSAGSGGAPGTGGKPASGGAPGTGGDAGIGGSMGTGGDAGIGGSGGSMGTGGDAGIGGSGGSMGTAGAPGAGGAGGSGGAGGDANTPVKMCFPWPQDGGPQGPCPTDTAEVLAVFESAGCPKGYEPGQIVSGVVPGPTGVCCYMVYTVVCGPGGRPYRVDERARLAAPSHGAAPRGWSDGDTPRLDGLTAEERACLAAAWTTAALSEHASVASFARFSLELLSVAAPADLVALAHEAALDEIRHARMCFALAAAYAGEALAPGPFPVGGDVRIGPSLAEIAAATVVDGCVGETVAAVVAAEQLARATDPAVVAALARIAADEARHAELAWRTVAWAVRAGGSEVRAAVARALVHELARDSGDVPLAGAPMVGPRPASLEAHGWLDAATLAAAAARARADVVGPAARALLGHDLFLHAGADAPV